MRIRCLKGRTVVLALVGLAIAFGFCLAGGAAAAGLDSGQLAKYYRKKKNLPPNLQVSVGELKDSVIKGAKQGVIQVGNPPNTRQEPFTVSADGRYVIFGEVDDLTIDPFKKVMEKLSLNGRPAKGPTDAKVTIVEFSDFQCPFCARGYRTIENQVLAEYGDKVRFVYKHFPLSFHSWAQQGAVAAECAAAQSEEAFWKTYTYFFENQKQITPANLKDKLVEALAEKKIDKDKFTKCLDNKETLERVKADMAEGQSVGVRGTPGFIINGRLVSGAQPFQAFKNVIDDELQAAAN